MKILVTVGNGSNIRDWIYVKDYINALFCVLKDGKIGKQYLIGGNNEISNYNLMHLIVNNYEKISNQKVDWKWFDYVEDRKDHDFRYAIDTRDFCMEFTSFTHTNFDEDLM